MQNEIVSFQGWGLTHLDVDLQQIADSTLPGATIDDVYEDLAIFIFENFDSVETPLDQDIKYMFIEASIGFDSGISIYIPRRLAMALQISYDITINQLTAVLEAYLQTTQLLTLKPQASVRKFVEQHYHELNVREVTFAP